MSDFTNSELRRLDLTLLLVFLGLIRHRKASDVAAELGLTQSGVSQALKRLRDILGDELFLRRPHGMEPTVTALALEGAVEAAVDALRGALGAARRFDPSSADGIVRVAALDAQQAVVIPALAARLRGLAPNLRLSVLPLARGEAVQALVEGRVDLALGYIWTLPDMICAEPLYQETYLVAALASSLPEAPKVSIDAYCAADHVLVAPGGDSKGIVDDALAKLGRSRTVTLALSAFLPALAAVAASGALVTLPAQVATLFAPRFGLVLAQPPLDLRSFPISAFWHRRDNASPQSLWLRQQIKALVSGV